MNISPASTEFNTDFLPVMPTIDSEVENKIDAAEILSRIDTIIRSKCPYLMMLAAIIVTMRHFKR